MAYRLLVISDLHVTDKDRQACPDSRISTHAQTSDTKLDPLVGLKSYVEEHNIRADALVCPGDITNKANPGSQAYAWRAISDLKTSAKAKVLVTVPGNHDLDSRNAFNDHDAKGNLLSLDPYFPGIGERLGDKFWARNFVVFVHGKVRYVLLNSAAYHGGGKNKAEEYEKGRVSSRTLGEMSRALDEGGDDFLLNILVTHHHPLKFDPFGQVDFSQMEGGDHLITSVLSTFVRPWFVVHGHRHVARLINGGATNSSPVIFCAGSLGSRLIPPVPQGVANQFHLVEFPTSEPDFKSLGLCGTISSWDWADGKGWAHASQTGAMPRHAGFGMRASNISLASDIATVVSGLVNPNDRIKLVRWNDVLNASSRLRFVPPADLSAVLKILEKDHNISAQQNALTGALSILEQRAP